MGMVMVNMADLIADSRVRFGTSGARGLVADMSDEVCGAYALAFLQAIAPVSSARVALAIDLRPSSPRIAEACAAAIRQSGFAVEYCGAIPTPALAYFARQEGIPAVMVTGSHIPFDRNGIKFYRATGEISKADEAAITSAVIELPKPIPRAALPIVNPAARRLYVERYSQFFPPDMLRGMRLGFYEHSSVARDVLHEILAALGAEVISLGRSDDFVPIDTEAVSQADSRQARLWAQEYAFDAIVSTDGDADRPLIGDENGVWFRGDVVGILCAQYLDADVVVTPVSSNTALEKCGSFASVRRTRIGSPFVIAGMEQAMQDARRSVVGFEANGGFLVGSRIVKHERVLEALPTRDAVLPVLALLTLAKERGCKLSELISGLPQRFTASDRLQDFPVGASGALLRQLATAEAAISDLLGSVCTGPVDLDETDGLRMTFANGEIVHFRPSGNAPELRCYAEADSPERAELLADFCLRQVQARQSHASTQQ